MITLKLWNSMTQKSRNEICDILGYSGNIRDPYHHNFDFDSHGKKLKAVLGFCNLQKDGTVNVTVPVHITLDSKPAKATAKKAVVKKAAKKKETPKLYKYTFRRYTSCEDDGEWCWCSARSADEAREIMRSEYWNTYKLELYRTEEIKSKNKDDYYD